MTNYSHKPIGKTFGSVTVIAEGPRHITRSGVSVRTWLCVCKCGNSCTKLASSICDKRYPPSCGCARVAAQNRRCKKHGHATREQRSPEYKVWRSMRQRCTDPNYSDWETYGGRGIKVCERWSDFENFLADMGPRPSSKHSIDRFPDRNGDYSPSNCRWATAKEQSRNRDYVKLTEETVKEIRALRGLVKGTDLAKRFGVSPTVISSVQVGRNWK